MTIVCPTDQQLEQLLRERGPMTARQVSEATGLEYKRVHDTLRRCWQAGRLWRDDTTVRVRSRPERVGHVVFMWRYGVGPK